MTAPRRRALRAPRLAGRASQRGLIFYAFVVMGLFAMAALYWASLSWQGDRRQRDDRILRQVRDALLVHLASPDLVVPGRRLGQFGYLPDLAFTGNGAALSMCATRTWAVGQPLTNADSAGAAARCFGRVPWASLNLDLGITDPVDLDGRIPWLIVSPNLAVSNACMPNLTPLVLGSPVSNTCPGVKSQMPFPWITVVDERGNVLTNRAAFALVMPGPVANGQVRKTSAAPSAWLGHLTVLNGCPLPCNPGTYDNAAYNHANGKATTLVTSSLSTSAFKRLTWIADPHEFHNRVLWVTVDELFATLEKRARRQLNEALLSFKASYAVYPYAAALNQMDGSCTSGLRFGHPAVLAGGCTHVPSLPSWWTNAGWHDYFLYDVSPTCIASSTSCTGPGLTLNGQNGYLALLVGPGAPITAAPFAPSKGAPQAPLTVASLSGAVADYVDGVANANGGATGVFTAVPPGSASDDDTFYPVQ